MNFLKTDKKTIVTNIIKNNGYIIENDEDQTIFISKKYAPLTSIKFEDDGSIYIFGFWKINQTGIRHNYKLLEFINNLNQCSKIAIFTYYNDENEGANSLCFHAVYTGEVKDSEFSKFLNQWHTDVMDMLNTHPETNMFLGDDEINNSTSVINEPVGFHSNTIEANA